MTQVTVFACTRCGLSSRPLPDGVRLVELPCTGRVSVPLLLGTIARNADGVLVLGRHQQTCRLNGAEEPARERAGRASDVLRYAGFGDRVRFANPEPGLRGPVAAVESFAREIAALGPRPVSAKLPSEAVGTEGIDTSIELCRWLASHRAQGASISTWLRDAGLPEAQPGAPAFIAGVIPFLDRVLGDLIRPVRMTEMVRMAIEVLAALGVPGVGVWSEAWPTSGSKVSAAPSRHVLCRKMRDRLADQGIEASPLSDLLIARFAAIPRPVARARVACDGSNEQRALIEALGYEPVDAGPDPLPDSFSLSREDRIRAEARLALADRADALAMLVPGQLSLARWAMLTREGTWRSTRAHPVVAHQLAWLSLHALPLSERTLTAPFASVTRKVAS